MKPEPGTGVLLGILAALFVLAVAFDSWELLVTASMILSFLAIHAFSFFLQVRSLVSSVTVLRVPEYQILRQGGITPILLGIRVPVPSEISVTVRDLIPPGTRIVQGTGEISLNASSPEVRMEYHLQAFSRGDLQFGGILVTVKDRYYTDTIHLGRGTLRTPLLHIQPAITFIEEPPRNDYGSGEVAQLRAIPGQGIRSFRRYQTGDDTRAIDWKLSAKHGSLILREYMGAAGGTPMFILDLPQHTDDPGLWDGLVASLTAHIERVLPDFSKIEVIVLSGGRIIHTLTLQRDARPWYRMIATLFPGEGFHALYHHPFPPVLASLHRAAEKAERTKGVDRPFFSRLAAVTGGFQRVATPAAFERQLAIAFARSPEREVFIYSLFQGDMSHIHETIHQAWVGRVPIHLRLPSHRADSSLMHTLLHAGATSVEVLP